MAIGRKGVRPPYHPYALSAFPPFHLLSPRAPSHIPRRAPPPELPAVPDRPVRLAVRDLDPDGRVGVAGAAPHQLRVSGGAGDDPGDAADSAVHAVWRGGGGPGEQAPAGAHP